MTLLTKSTYLKQEYREANVTAKTMLNSITVNACIACRRLKEGSIVNNLELEK